MEFFGIVLDEWQIWMILAVLLFIAEIFVPGFVLACLAIGMLLGSLASAIGLSQTWQLAFFSVGSLLAFLAIRPFILKLGYNQNDKIKTNADTLIGKKARVTEDINPDNGGGRVAIDGDNWKAVSSDNQTIEKGKMVEVISRDSIILTVKSIN